MKINFYFKNEIDDRSRMGDKYLRQCDSRYLAANMLRRELDGKGVQNVPLDADECGFDGNYGVTTLQENNV